MLALNVEKLSKTYEQRGPSPPKKALIELDLKVERGSILGLLGPNGAGKSTLINILAGLVRKTSGTAEIMGIDITKNPKESKKKIGVVPQEIALDTYFTVKETLEFYAGYYGIRPNSRKTSEILSALSLADKANATPRELSGGMKRRLLVAKAMVHSPDVLILDEPTAGVDIELRDHLWDYVLELNNKGTTIIITTHYLEEAEKLCDNIAFINGGKLICCESKDVLLRKIQGKELFIKLGSPISNIPDSLKKYQCKIERDALIIKYNKQGADLSEILQHISNESFPILDLSVKEVSLETVFRELYKNS
ncbi:MAG: ABC transporter ATP-binding protein [Rickettsiaceae bacterium]|nr:ABC transporter ATP-binding protein [Rickettsiaceae bacterium]